jgi:endonuclease/exonuclease/phosphatase family metal-dependent hydrolase
MNSELWPDGLKIVERAIRLLFVPVLFFGINVFGADSARDSECTGDPLIEPIQPAFVSGELPAGTGDHLRIAFYNIEMFTDGIQDGQQRNEALALQQARGAAAIVDEIEADILLVSEVENGRALGMLNDGLAKPFPSGYMAEFGTGGRRREKMNIGMLTRYQPESVHEIDFGPLTGEGRPTRGVFRAIFSLDEDRALLIYSTHLKSNWGSRKKNYAQRYHAMRLIKEDVERVVLAQPERSWEKLLMADFNSDPDSPQFEGDPTWQVLTDWMDLWSEHADLKNIHTLPTRFGDPRFEFPPALFDRILAHPGTREAPWTVSLPSVIPRGTATSNVNIKPGEGDHVSDHYPIYLDINR